MVVHFEWQWRLNVAVVAILIDVFVRHWWSRLCYNLYLVSVEIGITLLEETEATDDVAAIVAVIANAATANDDGGGEVSDGANDATAAADDDAVAAAAGGGVTLSVMDYPDPALNVLCLNLLLHLAFRTLELSVAEVLNDLVRVLVLSTLSFG